MNDLVLFVSEVGVDYFVYIIYIFGFIGCFKGVVIEYGSVYVFLCWVG